MPKPTPDVKTLILRYIQQDQDEDVTIPEWANQLQDAWHDEEEDAWHDDEEEEEVTIPEWAEAPGSWEDLPEAEAPWPWRTPLRATQVSAAPAHVSAPAQDACPSPWEDALEGHLGFGSPSPSPSSLSRRRHLHGSPFEAEPKRRKLSHEPDEQSEPPPPSSETEMPKPKEYPSPTDTECSAEPQAIFVDSCVQAIIGWEPALLGTPNIGIASLTLKATHLVIGLCGMGELTEASNRDILSGMVAILCGGGRWTKGLHHLLHPGVTLKDLSCYTTFQGTHNGVMPKLDQPYEQTFRDLIQDFQDIWRALLNSKRVPELVFFCKAGRHQSYALLIAFLMWAGHVHDHSVWANLIAPQRVQAGVQAELTWATTPGYRGRGWTPGDRDLVPFGDVLSLFAQFLNSTFQAHWWPHCWPRQS